ncbi:CAP domain-containing protein [Catellatospora sp. NPDC049609]|uniref:CAP domain-containing protein n=1 Tax=Catellatospora sp. NPDC049609 TaxID=3155505 RepID=UPI003425D598
MWPPLTASAALLSLLLGGAMAVGPALSAAPGPLPGTSEFTTAGGRTTARSVTGTGDPTGAGDTAQAIAAARSPVIAAVTPRGATRPAPATSAPRTPPAGARGPAPRPSPESARVTAMEDQVTSLINRERERAGCPPVHTDERLRAAARRHSADMAQHDYFSHTSRDGSSFVDRVADAGYPRRHAAGENIAYGYPTAESMVDAWMASTGHRSNILNCDARATGVGLAYQGRTPYWTQEFGRD